MNPEIKRILTEAEGRYFNETEEQRLLVYADTLAARLDAMGAIERAEASIIDDVVAAVMGQHGTIERDFGTGGAARVRRDQAMVLRYATLAMVQQEEAFIHDKLAVWLRTILFALCKPEQVMAGYRALVDACRRHLAESDAEAVVPYIQVLIREFEANGGRPS